MIVGLDFDNTIVCYDSLFHKVSVEQGLISQDFPINKIKIRDHLRSINKEDVWTEMQGYVYGYRMQEAEAFPFLLEFIDNLIENGHQIVVISHKTKYPFIGEKYDLHKAAKFWLYKNLITNKGNSQFTLNNCFFEKTKDQKVLKITEQDCDLYIDDLPEILENPLFPEKCLRILFDPENNYYKKTFEKIIIKNSWDQIIDFINSK